MSFYRSGNEQLFLKIVVVKSLLLGFYVTYRLHGMTVVYQNQAMEEDSLELSLMESELTKNPFAQNGIMVLPEHRVTSPDIGNYMKFSRFDSTVASRFLCKNISLDKPLEGGTVGEGQGGTVVWPKEYVVLSVTKDLGLVDYSFQAPIAASLWIHHIGVEVIMFIITSKEGGKDEWTKHPKRRLIVEELERTGAHIIFVPAEEKHHMLLGQNMRMYASLLPFVNDWDIITPSDVDIFPLNRNAFRFSPLFYCRKEIDGRVVLQRNSIGISIYNAFCCPESAVEIYFKPNKRKERASHMYPICHITMHSAQWKEVYISKAVDFMKTRMANDSSVFEEALGDSVLHNLYFNYYSRKELDARYSKPNGLFFADQFTISHAIEHSKWFPNGTLRITRDTGRDRIDRGNWPKEAKSMCEVVEGKNDVHNFQKTASNDGEWKRNIQVLECLQHHPGSHFTRKELQALKKYRSNFKKAAVALSKGR